MKLILFDFDGVLANTKEIAYRIHKVKNKDLAWSTFQEYLTGNFFEKMDKAIKDGRHIPPDDFYGEYQKGLATLNMHDEIQKMVVLIREKYKLVIISSTGSEYIKEFLHREGLLKCFSEILGADMHHSKVFKINYILEKYKSLPSEALFVSDTSGDIMEARQCDVATIGVTWGYHDKEILLEEKPFAIVDTPEELEEKIEEFFK